MFEVSPQPADLGRVRLAVTDLDGSLLLDDSTLPEGVEQRITALEGLGAEFAVASGRPLYTLHDNFGALLDELMVVADNGGLVVDHGKVIFKADMPVEDYRRMARITSEMGDYGFICGLDGCYVDAKAKPYEDFIRTFYTKCEFVDDLTQVDVPANKFTVMFPNNDALDQIGDGGGDALGDVVVGRVGVLDAVVQEGGDDGFAVEMQLLGYDLRNGDGVGDEG